MSNGFKVEAHWIAPKAVLKDVDGYPEIVPALECAIQIPFNNGVLKYFIMEKLELTNGKKYILEKYDSEKAVVTYRRIKNESRD